MSVVRFHLWPPERSNSYQFNLSQHLDCFPLTSFGVAMTGVAIATPNEVRGKQVPGLQLNEEFYMRFFQTVVILLLFPIQLTFAQPPYYFICGPDEDGCPQGYEEYCACIPPGITPNKPYCLDFSANTCSALSEVHRCKKGMIFANQASCLATIFQSEPNPPCPIAAPSFCYSHSASICAANGDPSSCKKLR